MKQLKLTEEHKSKLLEMCKDLFPEMDFYTINEDGMVLGTHGQSTDGIAIHWFEFVFTNLAGKIQEVIPENLVWREQPPFVGNIFEWKEGNKWTMYSEFTFVYPKACNCSSIYPQNPIDYLYNEFKKLK